MKVAYSGRAGQDLAEIVDFLVTRNRHAALVVAATIRKRIALLRRYPFSGRAQDIDGVKKAVTVPLDRKSTRLNSSHSGESRMPSSA